MQITEVRIKLMEESEDRLRAFCSITFDDCFVVRDLKIIDGASGPFVAMPSRKLSSHCGRCGHKNHLKANFCNQCGTRLSSGGSRDSDFESPQKLYADIAHPINSECREMIQDAVIKEFDAELSRAQTPGYQSRYDDEFEDAAPPKASEPTRSAPPPPHFGEAPEETDKSRQGRHEGDEDDFGAGIF